MAGKLFVDKIDPRLLMLIDDLAAGEIEPDPDDPDFLTHVYVYSESDDFGALAAAGFDVSNELGQTAIVTLPITSIEDLAARSDVVGVFAPRAGSPTQAHDFAHTTAQFLLGLENAWDVTSGTRSGGTKGAGVIIGIVDDGVDIRHDAFTNDVVVGGNHIRESRILSYWAQGKTKPGRTPLWKRNGRVFEKAELTAAISAWASAGTALPGPLRLPKDTHGTGTASVAAGSTWSAGPEALGTRLGIAPEADIVVASTHGGESKNYVRDALAGIEFCFETARALNRPCVVNMSLGTYNLPHNGLSIFAQRLRAMLVDPVSGNPVPGRVYVRSAGNTGNNHGHVKLSLTAPQTLTLLVGRPRLRGRDNDDYSLECLVSSSQPGLKVRVAPPGGAFTADGPVAQTIADHKIRISNLPSVRPQSLLGPRADSDSHQIILVNRPQSQIITKGSWRIRLDTGSTPHPDVHLWMETGRTLDTQQFLFKPLPPDIAKEDQGGGSEDPDFARRKEWIEYTLNSESSCREAIVVGRSNFVTDLQIEVPGRASSRGPTTDTLIPLSESKPDLAAPGDNIVVAVFRPSRRSLARSSISGRESGTSYSAPAVAGTVALMLSHDPTLTFDDIRTILRSTASPWAQIIHQEGFSPAGRDINERNIAGAGLLSISGAVTAAAARVP